MPNQRAARREIGGEPDADEKSNQKSPRPTRMKLPLEADQSKSIRRFLFLSLLTIQLLAFASSESNRWLVLGGANAAAQFQSHLLYLPSNSQQQQQQQVASTTSVLKRDLSNKPTTATGGQTTRSYLQNVCQVRDGESVAIVEIEESRGSDMSQPTSPTELPILGSVGLGEIELRIESETHKFFQIQDKRLRLTRPLDRDAILKENSTLVAQQPVSSIYLQVSCLDKREPNNRKVIIPVLVKVLDLNDNAPKFTQSVYSVQVNELASMDSVVLDQIHAIDLDSANNGLVEYSLAGQPPAVLGTTTTGQRLMPREMANLVTAPQPQTTMATPTITTTTGQTSATSQQATSGQPLTTTIATNSIDSSSSMPSSSFAPPPALTRSSSPTINLDSEPIVNGPMEEPDDDESDEALLAAMNSNSTSGESGQEVDMQEATSGPGSRMTTQKRRRRKRRHYEFPTTIMASANRRRMTTMPAIVSAATTITSALTTPKPQQLWTNLMGLAVESDASSSNQLLRVPQRDSNEFFSLEYAQGSNRPVIRLKKQLDYETQRVHTLTVVATDRATNPRERLSSQAKIIIRVLDGDDQGPAFVLDQTGCATSSFQPTTSDPMAFQASASAGQAAKRARRSVSFEDPSMTLSSTFATSSATSTTTSATAPQILQHRGFKVTDENFDFSDTLGEDEHEHETTGDSIVGPTSGSLASIAVPTADSIGPAGRTRRFPPTSQTLMPQNAQLQSTLARQQQPPTATTRSRYMDYTCLQPTNSQQVEYFASVMTGDTDYLLRVAPQAIKARDRDELNAPIRYSFVNGTPTNFSSYFQINPLDATIKQVAPLERQQAQEFVIWVQAQEQTVNKLSSLAKLTIEVIPTDKNPPILVPNSYSGFIEENSPVGSSVFISADPLARNSNNYSNLLRISVMDGDANSPGAGQSPRSAQLYEFETTSDAFKVNRDGHFYVNRFPLDRDPPNQVVHMFQVTARQLGLASSRSISSPISINITLLDLNDNPPILANSSLLAVHLTASNDRVARLVTTIRALDKDSPENARMFFSIKHVSNNGKDRFRINEESGDLEALGKFVAGEQFSLTIQVADELGRSSQGIVDVLVTPGPNTGGPQFVLPAASLAAEGRDFSQVSPQPGAQSQLRGGYQVEINEGIAPHSAVFQVQATDPENDPISYSIVDGNVNNDFYINSKTGTIYVANKLDREEVSAYSLLVQARDSGGLASARHVYIQIADNNDQNPTFTSAHYSFSVEEGVADRILGKVVAQDNDWQENGQVVYSLAAADSPQKPTTSTGRPMFAIDERSGEIKLLEPLDYEKAKSHALIVTAKDLGENPRSSTASVLVRVIDVQDEAPYFERYYYETRLVENVAQQRVAQVFAKDPDSVAQINYVLRSGDSSLFSVDQQTGLVTTTRGLDYEESRSHILLIGTQEQSPSIDMATAAEQVAASIQSGDSLERSPICRIDVTVIDTNDNAPYFAQQPLPVRIQDSAQLGTFVAKIQASDLDAGEPNNQIRYELVSSSDSDAVSAIQSMALTSDECLQLFMIDASSGSINIKSDLKRDARSECQLIVRARDLGQPSLSSSTSITIFIDHIAEISPTTQIGFADSSFTVELAENSLPNSLVKILPIINKPKLNFPLSCEIVSGNELGKFYVLENEQRDCELRVAVSQLGGGQQQQVPTVIDYEQKQKYSLTLKLNTLASSAKTIAHVNVNIIDRNDNKPLFYQPARYSHLTQQRFLAAIASDSPSETQVIQLRATDSDSPHSNGLVSYELLNDNELESRFKVDPIDGIVRTSRPVEDIPQTRLPLKLRVMARDNPETPSESLESIAEVVVNLIDDRHRLALVLKDTPTGRALDSKEELLGAIQERTGLIPGLERAESLKVFRNATLESDVSGTDFWFYLIEPGTFRIVSSDEPRIKSTLLDARAQNSLLDIVGQNLGFNKARVRLPYSISLGLLMGNSGRSLSSFSTLPSRALGGADGSAQTLIMFGLFIAITSAIVVLYQCGAWSNEVQSRATKEKLFLAQQQQRQQMQFQQQQQYGFSMAGGPTGNGAGLTATSQDFAALQSALATGQYQLPPGLNGMSGKDTLPYGMMDHSASQATFNKEYETQMLKMSVLFDDGHSVDEQNLSENLLIDNTTNHKGGGSHLDGQ